MSDREADAPEPREGASAGTVARLVNALELIASAHASRAKDEAKRDASRVVGGAVLLVAAVFLAIPVLLLADAAAALVLAERAALSLPSSLAVVAAVNAVLVVGLAVTARARLASPVLVETRATLKRAAIVLRG